MNLFLHIFEKKNILLHLILLPNDVNLKKYHSHRELYFIYNFPFVVIFLRFIFLSINTRKKTTIGSVCSSCVEFPTLFAAVTMKLLFLN